MSVNILYTGQQGSGPPTGPCTPTASGTFYLDISADKLYLCGSSGTWKLANL